MSKCYLWTSWGGSVPGLWAFGAGRCLHVAKELGARWVEAVEGGIWSYGTRIGWEGREYHFCSIG